MAKASIVDVDYLIIGAGMAGTVLDHFLRAEPGRKVLVDSNPGGYKVGESVAPEHFRHPELVALLDEIHELPSFTPKWGTLFSSADSVAAFPLSEEDHKRAMHIGRAELEQLMHRRWGTQIARERVLDVDVAAHTVRTDARTYRVAKQILDCSGPAMVVARSLGIVREQWPVYARWAYLDVVETDNDAFFRDMEARGAGFSTYDAVNDRHIHGAMSDGWVPSRTTLLHQVRSGTWIWQIPLFRGTRLSVGVVSREGKVSDEAFWEIVEGHINPMYKVRRRPASGETAYDRIHVRNHFAVLASPAASKDYVLVADALGFSDPIYSVGTALATNKAIELAALLNDGGWSAEKAAAWNRDHEDLYERANAAFDAWYTGEVLTDHSLSGDIQRNFLVGTAFQVGIATHYSHSLINSLPSYADDGHVVLSDTVHIPAAHVEALLQEDGVRSMMQGWEVLGAHGISHGVQLRFLAAGLPELIVNATDLAQTTAYYRTSQGFALSFMNLPNGPYPLGVEARRVFDALVAAMEADPASWRALAGLE